MFTIAMATTAMAMLYREPSGDVVMTDGASTTVRFLSEYGGAPEQWYAPGAPPLINEFPGSGVSIAFRSGQDPTQASANGIMKNPIARLGDPSTNWYNYYGRETVFSPSELRYEVRQFIPDFWLSAEPCDDAIAPNPDGGRTGWRTPYDPGDVPYISAPTRPIVFEGSMLDRSGIIFVGDERIDPSEAAWSTRLREYRGGRQAIKVNISLAATWEDGAFAGVLMRKTVPYGAANKDDAYRASGIHIIVTRNGRLGISRMLGGSESHFGVFTLSQDETLRLNSERGLELELSTHNNIPGYLEVHAARRFVTSIIDDMALDGPHLGLLASPGKSGRIVFQERAPYDVGVEVVSRWEAIPNRGIVSDVTIRNAPGVSEPHQFDRANMPAAFLNQLTFENRIDGSGRVCAVVNGTEESPEFEIVEDGHQALTEHLGFWCGNAEGTLGLYAIPEIATIDGKPERAGHVLMRRCTENGEFVLMLNPLRRDAVTEAREIRLRTRWQTRVLR